MKKITISAIEDMGNDFETLSMLSRIYRRAITALNVNGDKFKDGVHAFLAKENGQITSQGWNSLIDELSAANMTPSTFRKGMRVLGVKEINITFEMAVEDNKKEDQNG